MRQAVAAVFLWDPDIGVELDEHALETEFTARMTAACDAAAPAEDIAILGVLLRTFEISSRELAPVIVRIDTSECLDALNRLQIGTRL